MRLLATYFGSNGWLLEFGSTRVLVDPWLTGSLVFPPGAWLLKGELLNQQTCPSSIDLLLLTQGLPDHAHPASMKLLPLETPVVGSKSAAKLAIGLGFTNVRALNPGEILTISDVQIRASAGAPVPSVENGYLIKHPVGSLYLEPHGFLDKNLEPQPLDAVITPMVDIQLPGLGAFVRGRKILPELIELFAPKTILASTTGGDVRFSGLLSGLLQIPESADDVLSTLPPLIHYINPELGVQYALTD